MELRSFWLACETAIGQAAVEVEWKRLAGDDYQAARAFLRPRQELATSFPCPRHPPCACYHRVVRHGDGRIAAVCACNPRRCDTVALTESDLIVYELDRPVLYAAIASALSLQPARSDVLDLPWVTRIGFSSPCAGYRFPAYVISTPRPERFTNAVSGLAAANPGPFIVVAPTERALQPGCLQMLDSRPCLFLTLSDVLSVDPGGMPIPAERCAQMLAEFHQAIIPALTPGSPETSPIAFFPTPANATWSDVQVLFRDGHTVSISVGDRSGIYNYTQMGMSKKNTGEPSNQWQLLEAFAEGHGALDWDSRHADPRQKKRKHLLSQALRRFFRIEEDPFRYVQETKSWEARFDVGFCQ